MLQIAKFNVEAMELFAKEDMLVNRMITDLSKRNPHSSRESILEVVFNSEVLEDEFMQYAYLECHDILI